jgi:predicted GNAT superfamily acetyltransferase
MLRDAEERDWPAVLALNDASVEDLSPMDAARLARLVGWACYFRVIEVEGQVAAFLLGFRKGAGYDGEIFGLFSRQEDDFVYIDRVVVDARCRGRGLAGRLYDDIGGLARAAGVGRLLCEAYVTNEVSRGFHRARGFREIGRQVQANGKTVSLLEFTLTEASGAVT